MATTTTVDYRPDRYVALDLVGRGMIVAVGGVTRQSDGDDLTPGVFAALITLRVAGCLELQRPEAGSPNQQWPVRLTPVGVRLLREFTVEHDGRQAALATGHSDGVGSSVSAPVRRLAR